MMCIHTLSYKLLFWTTPLCRGGIRCHHVSCGPVPHILAEVSFDAVMCPSALDLASLMRWALVLPRVTWLWALSFWEGSSGAAICPTARDSAFLKGELLCCHVSHGPWRAVNHRNKEKLSCPRHAARLACFQGTLVRYWSAYRRACRYSVAP
jgi:hypothetical protein